MVITTPEDAETELTTVVYPITDLVRFRDSQDQEWADYDTLIETIISTIAPDSWDEVGGAGAVEGMNYQDTDVLLVSQTQDVQRNIAQLLETLRAITNKKNPDGKLPVKEQPVPLPGYDGGMGGGMGGYGGGMGGFRGPDPTQRTNSGTPSASRRAAKTLAGPGLLKGLQETKRRLQGKQVDNLQRIYDRGQGGMGGGVGAGGMF